MLNILPILLITTCRFGCCEVIISDQGREFVNKVKEELLQLTGLNTVSHQPTTHRAMDSRKDSTRLSRLLSVNDTQDDWDEHLSSVLFTYRTAQQKATKMSPFEVMFCRQVQVFINYYC